MQQPHSKMSRDHNNIGVSAAEIKTELKCHSGGEINKYALHKPIDYEEVFKITKKYNENKACNIFCEEQDNGSRNIFVSQTNKYEFKSCFKDRTSVISAFDYHSGHLTGTPQPYDITETPTPEKVKRFYRKNINDPWLNSWYQYNLLTSNQDSLGEARYSIKNYSYGSKVFIQNRRAFSL